MDSKRKKLKDKLRRFVRGQSTVEFALLLFFLLIPLLVVVEEAARAYSEQEAVAHAANIAARWATLTPAQQSASGFSSMADVIFHDLQPNGIDYGPATTIPITLPTGFALEVYIPYTHTVLFPRIPVVPIQTTSLHFTAKATMQCTTDTRVVTSGYHINPVEFLGQRDYVSHPPGDRRQVHIEVTVRDAQDNLAEGLSVSGKITCGGCPTEDVGDFQEMDPGHYVSRCSTTLFPGDDTDYDMVVFIRTPQCELITASHTDGRDNNCVWY